MLKEAIVIGSQQSRFMIAGTNEDVSRTHP